MLGVSLLLSISTAWGAVLLSDSMSVKYNGIWSISSSSASSRYTIENYNSWCTGGCTKLSAGSTSYSTYITAEIDGRNKYSLSITFDAKVISGSSSYFGYLDYSCSSSYPATYFTRLATFQGSSYTSQEFNSQSWQLPSQCNSKYIKIRFGVYGSSSTNLLIDNVNVCSGTSSQYPFSCGSVSRTPKDPCLKSNLPSLQSGIIWMDGMTSGDCWTTSSNAIWTKTSSFCSTLSSNSRIYGDTGNNCLSLSYSGDSYRMVDATSYTQPTLTFYYRFSGSNNLKVYYYCSKSSSSYINTWYQLGSTIYGTSSSLSGTRTISLPSTCNYDYISIRFKSSSSSPRIYIDNVKLTGGSSGFSVVIGLAAGIIALIVSIPLAVCVIIIFCVCCCIRKRRTVVINNNYQTSLVTSNQVTTVPVNNQQNQYNPPQNQAFVGVQPAPYPGPNGNGPPPDNQATTQYPAI